MTNFAGGDWAPANPLRVLVLTGEVCNETL